MDLERIERDRAERHARWRTRGVYADFTHADAFRQGAGQFPGVEVIFHSRVRPARLTVGEAYAISEQIAGALHALGFVRGDRLAVMLPTWADATLAYMAALKLGVAVIPIVAIYGGRELGFIMRQTGAKGLIVPTSWRGHDYMKRVRDAGAMPALEHLFVIGQGAPVGAIDWDSLQAQPAAAYPPIQVPADDVCCILYTSGTTADPKGVKHTHNTLLCDINAVRAGLPPAVPVGAVTTAGPSLNVFPAGHIAGFLAMLRPFLFGLPAIFMDQMGCRGRSRPHRRSQGDELCGDTDFPVVPDEGSRGTARRHLLPYQLLARRLCNHARQHPLDGPPRLSLGARLRDD